METINGIKIIEIQKLLVKYLIEKHKSNPTEMAEVDKHIDDLYDWILTNKDLNV